MSVVGEAFQPSLTRTFRSTNDLSTKQGYGVALDASNENAIVLANAQTLPSIGVLVYPPSGAGDECKVALFGPTFIAKAGGTVAKGAYVTVDANGKFIATTSANDNVYGRALEAAVDGDQFEVMLMGGFRY